MNCVAKKHVWVKSFSLFKRLVCGATLVLHVLLSFLHWHHRRKNPRLYSVLFRAV